MGQPRCRLTEPRASHPSPEKGRSTRWVRPGQAGHSLTDLAVRVGEAATAVKTWIVAILQRSAAEPVGTRGSVSRTI